MAVYPASLLEAGEVDGVDTIRGGSKLVAADDALRKITVGDLRGWWSLKCPASGLWSACKRSCQGADTMAHLKSG